MAELMAWLETVTGGDKLLMGFISAPVIAVASGIVGMMLTRIPKLISDFFWAQCVTSMDVHNGVYMKREVFTSVSDFIYARCTMTGSRTLSVESIHGKGRNSGYVNTLSIGYGRHFFIYKNRLLWVQRIRLDAHTSEITDQMTISTIGRSHTVFHDLLRESTPQVDHSLVPIWSYSSEGWFIDNKIKASGLDRLALEPHTRDFFKERIEFFRDNREGYSQLGLPYKMSFLLHGLPGTGKTSIIRSLAAEYKLGICLLNLNTMSDDSLAKAFSTLPKGVILAIEDFDTVAATRRRDPGEKDVNVTNTSTPKDSGDSLNDIAAMMGISLSGILNVLDGVCALDDVIVFMTTNYPERLDSAIVRPGRIDYSVELPVLSAGVVKEHFELMYPDTTFGECGMMLGCEINRIKNLAKMDGSMAAQLLADKE